MATSRIFVRNLPVNLTEKDFRAHFSKQHPITDTKLIPHRRIGYVGFKTPEEATAAVKYFNKTFIRMSRLQVELALPVNDSALHPTGLRTATDERIHQASLKAQANDDPNPLKRKRAEQSKENTDPKLQEYLNIMQAPSKMKSWMNKEIDEQPASEELPVVPTQEDEQSDGEYQAIIKKPRHRDEHQSERTETSTSAKDEVLLSEEPPITKEAPANTMHPSRRQAIDEEARTQNDDDWLQSRTGQLLGLENDAEAEEKEALVDTPKKTARDEESESEIAQPDNQTWQHDSRNAAIDGLKPVEADQDVLLVDEAEAELLKTKRLFIRNLPFTVTEEALSEEFSTYGRLEEVHVPMSSVSGTGKGFAYLFFGNGESAVNAYKAMDGAIFQGRLIHILPAAAKRETKLDEFAISKLPLKQQRQIKRKNEASTSSFNWNSMYMNPDAIMSSIASRLGVEKSTLLDPTSSDAAVKQTQAETHVIQETKAYFAEHGVDLESFKSKKRGDTAILVKNFPFGTTPEELRKMFEDHGTITRLLMPPAGTIAIVEFANAPEARSAFKGLAYRKLKDSILFLEPAPKDLFTSAAKPIIQSSSSDTRGGAVAKISATDLLRSEPEPESMETTTLHVRNLNFTTTTEKLIQLFSPIDGFVSGVVRTRFDPKRNETLSRGYGFLEFRTKEQAHAALQAMNGYTLEGHKLDIKVSQKTLDAGEERRKEDKAKSQASRRTKIIIKNLAFEASKKDIRELVKPYGSIRSVRLPKKYDSSLRGFAFVEFSTPLEAQQAHDALRHSHYHGRRLVIEFAEADAEDAEVQLEQMAAKVNSQVNKVAAQKLTGPGRKKFNIAGDDPDS